MTVTRKGVWAGKNNKVLDVSVYFLEEIIESHRPKCTAKDGIELVDDVGGIRGFCDMLKIIYEADRKNDEAMEQKDSMLEWAFSMGWTGRKISPEKTL